MAGWDQRKYSDSTNTPPTSVHYTHTHTHTHKPRGYKKPLCYSSGETCMLHKMTLMYTDKSGTKTQPTLHTSLTTLGWTKKGFAFLSINTSLLIWFCCLTELERISVSYYHDTIGWITNCCFWPRPGLDRSQTSQEMLSSYSLVKRKINIYRTDRKRWTEKVSDKTEMHLKKLIWICVCKSNLNIQRL